MKMSYLIIGILILGGLSIYLAGCKNKKNTDQGDSYISKSGDSVKVHTLSENNYQKLRNMALGVTHEELMIDIPDDQTKIYGVVMDWDMGDVIATLISFSTGDASMYVSSGGGLIGGGHHENVSKATKAFISISQKYLDKGNKIEATPLPEKNCVRFYFMTNKGKFTAQENITNFDNNSSQWLPLFEEANKVISELRIIQEK